MEIVSQRKRELLGYIVAISATAVALVVRWPLYPLLEDKRPYLTLFGAVAFAVWFGGWRPATLAAAVGFFTANYFFSAPHTTFEFSALFLAELAAYAVSTGFIIYLGQAMRTAQYRTREEHERMRTTIASIGDAVIATNTTGCVTIMNGVAESLTGWKISEAAGQPLGTVFHIINEHTRGPVENPVDKVLGTGLVVGLANHTVLISKEGTERPIDDSAAPIRCSEGTIVGCVLVFRDITERRRLERENAERAAAAHFLASIVRSSEDIIISKSLDGTIRSWNAAADRLFGYTADEAIGRSISLLIPPDHSEEEERIQTRLLAGERISHFDTVRLRKGGKPIDVSLTISPITDEAGKILGASKIIRDISERKRVEKQVNDLLIELKGADRRKDEFLATLSHELRGPLAPLSNMLEIITRAGGDGELIQHAHDTMERQLRHLVRLVDDLLDVSRISSNKLVLRLEDVELMPIVHQAIETCRPLASDANHELNVTAPSGPIYVRADSVRLAQVFGNLLGNACKYTEPGGKIWVLVERQGSDAVVRVTDTGNGIPADMLPRVFDIFTQGDRSMDHPQLGLGIGLSLVKRLVEMHGGSVSAASDGLGKGSEFTVRLPIIIESMKSPKPPQQTSTPQPTGLRVLVVDDNRDSAKSLAMLLKISGNETAVAYDGVEAIDVAQQFAPDMVLLDLGLPKLSGYDAARQIRQQPWGEDILLVALTGWGQDEDRHKSKDAGFDHHLVKPVDYNSLMILLDNLRVRQM